MPEREYFEICNFLVYTIHYENCRTSDSFDNAPLWIICRTSKDLDK